MIRNLLILALLSVLPLGMSAQLRTGVLSDSAKIAEYREKIGIDYSMPDYSVKKIDESKIGSRLTSLLRYMEENLKNSYFNQWITFVVKEQNESLKEKYFEVEKLKLVSVSKSGNEISIKYKVSLSAKKNNFEPLLLNIQFLDGVSESNTVNDMFSYMSHYVQAREQLEK